MKIFKNFTLKWWQLGLLKVSLIALGIILGVYFQFFFLPVIVLITIIFIVPAIYIFGVWAKQ